MLGSDKPGDNNNGSLTCEGLLYFCFPEQGSSNYSHSLTIFH